MNRPLLFWILSLIITITAAYYQRVTGPTYPLKGNALFGGNEFSYTFLRTHGGEGNAAVQLSGGDSATQCFVEWKRFKTHDKWTTIPMISAHGLFTAELPHQPPAGKLEYRVLIENESSRLALPPEGSVVIRFKGDVPAGALIPHVIAMFAAMLLSTRSGLECFSPRPHFKRLVYWTVALMTLGGMILGPIVQKYAFGEYWTGIPFGTDLTDNKTLIAFVVWLAALVAVLKSRHPARWVASAAVVTLVIFLIPHSLFGSEIDYSKEAAPSPLPIVTDNNACVLGKFSTQLRTLSEAERGQAVKTFLLNHPVWPLIERDTIASFVWFGRAHVVAINGDLQFGWSMPDTLESIPCGNDTLFMRTYTIPANARLDYLFLIDGKAVTDPRNPRITPSGYGPHSEVAMPNFVSNSARVLRRDVVRGTLDSLVFTSSNDSIKPRQLIVYRPAGYEQLTAMPSLYIQDGIEAMEYAAYTTVLDNLIHDKKIEPVIVVFIPMLETDGQYLFENHREYSDRICDEMVPLVDKKYRTATKPERRAMAGISAGGQFSLMVILDRPDVFRCAAGQSPTIKAEHFDELREMMNKNDRPAIRFYIDVGRYDLVNGGMKGFTFLQAATKFHEELEGFGLSHAYYESNGGHQWADWRERTEEILMNFFGTAKDRIISLNLPYSVTSNSNKDLVVGQITPLPRIFSIACLNVASYLMHQEFRK